MKIYIVTRGVYSDYKIVEVFSTIEKAVEWLGYDPKTIDRNSCSYYCNCDETQIEEYDIDNPQSHYRIGYLVSLDREGNLIEITNHHSISITNDDYIFKSKHHEIITYNTKVITKSKTKAIKVANERRIMYIANDEKNKYIYKQQKRK